MEFEPLLVAGAYLIRPRPVADDRGFFARITCVREFRERGLPTLYVQSSISFNARRYTVRGMHFQWPPGSEGKLVRCVRGALFDVLLDLRPESPTYLQHADVVIDDRNRDAVYIPHGVAHGFQSLADSTEVLYQMTDYYAAELAAGFRWNDPAFRIQWPMKDGIIISERDAQYPDFDRRSFEDALSSRSRSRQ